MIELSNVLTADCSNPREIDDGLHVEQLDASHELYRVSVCVADTSRLYDNGEILSQALARTGAKYWDLPDGERGYDPMIEPEFIKEHELTAGNVRSALIVSFLVGERQRPSEVDASFGQIEIASNQDYKQFAYFALDKGTRFARAGRLIRKHLRYTAYGDHAGSQPAWRGAGSAASSLSENAWKRGSKLNESFMVAANHLVGQMLAEEGRPAIYRVHDPDDEQYLELLSASVARFSRTPGPHTGLGLNPYCRVTSPLRRLDDFVMNYQLKQRDLGRGPTAKDSRGVAFAIRRLNQELIAAAPKDASHFSRQDILGKSFVASPSELAI